MALTDNLVSYWKLDEASGNRADSHGSATLTDNNTVGSATGKINNGADFEFDNAEHLSNAAFAAGTACSVSAWVKFEAVRGYTPVLHIKDGSNHMPYFAPNNALRFCCYLQTTGGQISVDEASGGTELQAATDYHAVLTYDNATGIRIYINGSLERQGSTGQGNMVSATAALAIGFEIGTGRYFDGVIDEVGFWSRALTSDEVTELYNGGNGLSYDNFGGGGGVAAPRRGTTMMMTGVGM